MKQKNNHARSKQRRKSLRMKNKVTRFIADKTERALDSGNINAASAAGLVALDSKRNRQAFDSINYRKRTGTIYPKANQRKRRKLARQTGRYKC